MEPPSSPCRTTVACAAAFAFQRGGHLVLRSAGYRRPSAAERSRAQESPRADRAPQGDATGSRAISTPSSDHTSGGGDPAENARISTRSRDLNRRATPGRPLGRHYPGMTDSPHPGIGTPLLCELHAHSTWSDGRLPLGQVVDTYGQRGFDVLCITDHVVRTPEMVTEECYPAYLTAVREEVERAEREYGMLVIPGLELTYDDHD